MLDCQHFVAGRCRSCTWLETPYDDQVAAKQRAVEQALAEVLGDRPAPDWEPPLRSAPAGFRTKAKMVVGGTLEDPTLGILDPEGEGVDLRDCQLHSPGIVAALPVLAEFVAKVGVAPYDVPRRSGELKHLLVTESPDGELMVRFVLRSTEAEARIRKHLGWLREQLPVLRVATLNVQPAHAAILEGDREIVLTDDASLPLRLPDVTLHLGPRSFFQTNTAVATALYRQAQAWVADLPVRSVVDLYCGVGGFALHLAGTDRQVTGVEISADAVAAAERARDEAGLSPERVRFTAGDATAVLLGDRPDLVVVNPPRRGLGTDLAARLEADGPAYVVYSSCHPATLARDLAVMRSYRPLRARLFDMFPQTAHAEVLVLLAR